jgi:hypothetical protein
MSLSAYLSPPQPNIAAVPIAEYRKVCQERDEARSKLSATATILQNPSFTWKERAKDTRFQSLDAVTEPPAWLDPSGPISSCGSETEAIAWTAYENNARTEGTNR